MDSTGWLHTMYFWFHLSMYLTCLCSVSSIRVGAYGDRSSTSKYPVKSLHIRNRRLYTISSLAQGSEPKLLNPRNAGGLGRSGVSSHFGRALRGMGLLLRWVDFGEGAREEPFLVGL